MAWVRSSDDEHEWPAVSELSDAAFRLRIAARNYACRALTDGYVPLEQPARLIRLRATAKTIRELLEAGLWHDAAHGLCAECIAERERAGAIAVAGKGYVIHGFFPDQLPRHKVLAEREGARQRMHRIRAGLASTPDRSVDRGAPMHRLRVPALEVAAGRR